MRNASLVVSSETVEQLEAVYGKFDLDLDGYPTQAWVNRNLKRLRMPEMLEHQHFSGAYLVRVLVNRRMMGALERVYLAISARWPFEARRAYGLNRFVKCYCFGDGLVPSLFWYGGAWELSPSVNGEVLDEVTETFRNHGFKHDRKRLRIFEYW